MASPRYLSARSKARRHLRLRRVHELGNDSVRLSYRLYFFLSVNIILFLSHNKSANTIFTYSFERVSEDQASYCTL